MAILLYVTVHPASEDPDPFSSGWLVQPAIGCPLSKNSTDPDGSTRPASLGTTSARNVVFAPAVTGLGTVRKVEVASLPIVTVATGLPELVALAVGLAVKTAVSFAVDVANDVWQKMITLWLVDATGSFAQPPIGLPPFSNVIVPDGGMLDWLDVTVAIRITF